MKTCNTCLIEKTDDWFRKKYGRQCVPCRKARDKAYYETHKEEYYRRERNINLRYEYGLTMADYDKMMEEQNNRCAICRVHISKMKQTFCVDHSHVSKKVRGLLCHSCNVALGLLKDNPRVVKRAWEYLECKLPRVSDADEAKMYAELAREGKKSE